MRLQASSSSIKLVITESDRGLLECKENGCLCLAIPLEYEFKYENKSTMDGCSTVLVGGLDGLLAG